MNTPTLRLPGTSLATLLAALLPLAGCIAGDGETGAADDADLDDIDLDTRGPGGCSPWAPVDLEGATWSWSTDDDYERAEDFASDWTVTAEGARESGGETLWVTRAVGHDATSEVTSDWEQESRYRCDDEGVWLVWTRVEVADDWGYGPQRSWIETEYDQPYLVMPDEPTPGDGWSVEVHASYTTDSGYSGELTITDEWEVGEAATVEVPAGTFEALPFTVDGGIATWTARGVGGVMQEGRASLQDFSTARRRP